MALQVWLPLTKDLRNQGLSDVTVTNNGATFNSAGKLGGCYKTSSTATIDLGYNGNQINSGSISFGGWFKFNKAELWSVMSGYSYTSTRTTPTGNLIGNNSYGGVSLQWYTNNIYNDNTLTTLYVQGYLRSTTNGAKATSGVSLPFDTWVHIFFTFDKLSKVMTIWLNGEAKYTFTNLEFTDAVSRNLLVNYSAVAGGNGPSFNIPFLINDVRIYDNCLSPMEVKELAKGLVLHYTLGDKAIESTTNLFYPLIETSRNTSPAWDKTLNGNYMIHCNGFGDGYNGGVSNPTMGYHGHWTYDENNNLIGILPNLNSVIGQTNRWLGLTASVPSTSIGAGNSYTISWEQKTDNLNCYTNAGYYYKKNSSESGYGSFHDGTKNCKNTLINTWQPMEISFTLSQDWDGTYTGGTVYFYGHYGSEGTTYLRNLQFETKNHATAFVNGLTTRTSNIVYDCSGFCNNGEITGALHISHDTPKYKYSTNFSSGANFIRAGRGAMVTDGITVSIWTKYSTWGNPISCTEGGGWNFENGSNSIRFPVYVSGIGYKLAESNIAPSTLINGWHMITGTFDKTNVKIYIDGELKGTTTTGSTNGIAYPSSNVIFIGAESAGSATSPESYNFVGNISDFRIYATALSSDDIKSLYESNKL